MRFLTALSIMTLALTAQAEVYKSVDKYGNVTYTDDPSSVEKYGDKAEKVEVRPTNVLPAGDPIKLQAPREERSQSEDEGPQYNVRIVSPTNEHTVTPGQRDLIIAVATEQPLGGGAKFAYFMDGELLGTTTDNNYSIREIFRGEHQIRVEVHNAQGETLSSSESVTVYVHRASRLSP
ncbi:DUF4124 domain-containing protein [Gilvimarinus xylanilyticus]|uniref:DUF4124 domain-containing protein n=1 Tax=Gilvimarinus xylanilyticus TaxID=2944139 RepID=A0A9X2KU00_9GAMM|nr:DUF4124 domain-containing protein [Gilvimarinus xylanilyticus]MCP8899834.1 DUF4124 domain-containing protein [Gilvimarinus xylanilyticus]